MESQKAETWRFASNDSSDLSVANRRSSGFLRDRHYLFMNLRRSLSKYFSKLDMDAATF
jgi:hypothetical protein